MIKINGRNEFSGLQSDWIGELVAGTYQQAKTKLMITTRTHNSDGSMHRSDSFCCLGLMCKAMGLPVSNVLNAFEGEQVCRFSMDNIEYGSLPPSAVSDQYRLYEIEGKFVFPSTIPHDECGQASIYVRDDLGAYVGEYAGLAQANDNGLSFKQIGMLAKQFPFLMFMNFDWPEDQALWPRRIMWDEANTKWDIIPEK